MTNNHNKLSDRDYNELISLYLASKYKEMISFIKTIEIKNDIPIVYNFLGAAYAGLDDFAMSVFNYKKSIELDPYYLEAYINLSEYYRIVKDYENAIKVIKKALKINKNFSKCYFNLGLIYEDIGLIDLAIINYKKTLKLDSDKIEASNNIGILYYKNYKFNEAMKYYNKALETSLTFPETYNNIGLLLKYQGKNDQSLLYFNKALELKPDFVDANYNIANLLKDIGEPYKAITYYNEVLKLEPDNSQAISQKLFQLASICDWKNIDQYKSKFKSIGITKNHIEPFTMLTFDDSAERSKKRSQLYFENKFQMLSKNIEVNFIKKTKHSKIKIGYFSATFHNHAMMYLIYRLLELHNRDMFEIIAYSFGPQIIDEMNLKCKNIFDDFKDVSNLSDLEVKQQANLDGIDIAIDLMGYTKNHRASLFSQKLAPVQINFLGYPGTMGNKYIDYIIADKIVIPEKDKKYYSEKILYLPHCYQATDNTRKISNKVFTKSECNLPENSFVFCCFNNNYKISIVEFKIWMNLLKNISGSVLWLKKTNEIEVQNLLKYAYKAGIEKNRIIFADHIEMSLHLSRHSCIDLFLDTFNVNAHTTASDALWSGVPVLTKIGKGFASRVAASLLTAVNMTELITESNKDYENLALEIALNKNKLKNLKNKLKKNIVSSNLFNTVQYTIDFEQLLIGTIDSINT